MTNPAETVSMETLESLASSLETTADIQAVVRTMKSLSAASIHQYESAADAIAEYSEVVDRGLQVVLREQLEQIGGFESGLRHAGSGGRGAVIVIGSDRGLCGRFNDRIADFAVERLLDLQGASGSRPLLGVLGLRAAARLSAQGHEADHVIALPGSAGALVRSTQEIITYVDRLSREHGVTRVLLAYNSRGAGAGSSPVDRRLIPVGNDYLERLAKRPWPSRRLPMFRQDAGVLLDWLLREHIFVTTYQSIAESLASEHAARLASMQNAERNIAERQDELKALYRRKRQESITRELLDIVAGFDATEPQE
jgi:F-type H+-transporting ATPase subunit gamma